MRIFGVWAREVGAVSVVAVLAACAPRFLQAVGRRRARGGGGGY